MTSPRIGTGLASWPALFALAVPGPAPAPVVAPVVIGANDNVAPAGRLTRDTLALTLEARLGHWYRPVTWRPLAKDAMPVAASLREAVPVQGRTSVGETYDFESDAGTPRTLTLMVRNSRQPMASQVVEIR
ncbi:MAG: hypothetical protein H6Q77_793 [Gemmatimonadetes bacterium]|nr:hypothetical protein [Gemmatimonadota bacterium]